MRLSLGHLPPEVEVELLMTRRADPLASFKPIASAAELEALHQAADAVSVSKDIAEYAVRLSGATRTHSDIERGASTRAVLSLIAAARAHALWEARDFVTPGDLRAVVGPALGVSSAHSTSRLCGGIVTPLPIGLLRGIVRSSVSA